jgi:hypothetical protein
MIGRPDPNAGGGLRDVIDIRRRDRAGPIPH